MLEGELVNLRPREGADAARMTRWFNDFDVTLYLGARYPISSAAEAALTEATAARAPAYADLVFSIETKQGEHIGGIGLHGATPENRCGSLGMFIGEKDLWSRGYGTDALRTLLRFAFEEMDLHRMTLEVYDFNERGIASYRKCGFVEEGRRRQSRFKRGAYHDVIRMGLLRDGWAALQEIGARTDRGAQPPRSPVT